MQVYVYYVPNTHNVCLLLVKGSLAEKLPVYEQHLCPVE